MSKSFISFFLLSLLTTTFAVLFFSLPAQATTITEKVPINNPLAPSNQATNSRDIQDILSTRISDLLSIMFALLGTLSIFPVVVGSIQLILSRGNSNAVTKAKNTLVWGVLGLAAGVLGVVIFTFLLDLLIQTT